MVFRASLVVALYVIAFYLGFERNEWGQATFTLVVASTMLLSLRMDVDKEAKQ